MDKSNPDPRQIDLFEPEVEISSSDSCLICQSPMRHIYFRPLPICTACLYELSARIDEMQEATVGLSMEIVGHSQN
jgi:hypothetical protein